MNNDWERGKREYINNHCKSNVLMRQIAEMAFAGDPVYQELFAEWLEEQGNSAEAETWRKKAAVGKESKGHFGDL